jgi:hypothetical protein
LPDDLRAAKVPLGQEVGPEEGPRMTNGDRRYRLDEQVDLHADLLSGALNGDRRGGDEPTFVEIGIVVKDRWGQLKKVMAPLGAANTAR